MKPLLIAVLLAIMQAPPLGPGETAGDAGEHHKQQNERTGQQQAEAAQLPPIKRDAIHPAGEKQTGAENAQQPDTRTVEISKLPQWSLRRDRWDWIAWGAGIALALVGIGGICLALRTVRAIEEQAKAQMDADRAWVLIEGIANPQPPSTLLAIPHTRPALRTV